ncbi:UNVERIFIED_CONTAM: hypothetical protein GTU68_034812 [Idotea baltica]|nr:hypothetical protein [Idotea baltica]
MNPPRARTVCIRCIIEKIFLPALCMKYRTGVWQVSSADCLEITVTGIRPMAEIVSSNGNLSRLRLSRKLWSGRYPRPVVTLFVSALII